MRESEGEPAKGEGLTTGTPSMKGMAGTAAVQASLPRFVTGSTMRHVVVMTAAGSVGLIAIFLVDFLTLIYISRLGDPHLTAAIGFATIVQFFAVSISIGLMIAVGAVVSRALGSGNRAQARRLAGSATLLLGAVGLSASLLLLPLLPWLLGLIGADAATLPVAQRFLWITLPSNVLMAVGMGFSGVLRAAGDARRSMYVTVSGGIVVALLDPVLIFALGLGTDGAAIAIVLSRIVFVYVGYWGASGVHDLVARPRLAHALDDFRPLAAVGGPAILTNLAPPVANAFLASVVARFGGEAVAATTIIDRIVPVAFGGLFALTGAIGPILGQNWGAERFDRMIRALRDGLVFAALYVAAIWLMLVLLRAEIVWLFDIRGETARIVLFFCLVGGPIWFCNGLLFLANASFNNLGFPLLSTAFNWGRATLGTMPLAYAGAQIGGPEGALVGAGFGSLVFGLTAVLTAFWTIRKLARRASQQAP